jgi:hypothetical protein
MDFNLNRIPDDTIHSKNMNRVDGFRLSKSWKPLNRSLRDCRKLPEHYNGLRSLCLHVLNSPSPSLSQSPLVCYLLGSRLSFYITLHYTTPVFSNWPLHTPTLCLLPIGFLPGEPGEEEQRTIESRRNPFPLTLQNLFNL